MKRHVPLVGLSALMTTTVPSMEETIRRLRKEASWEGIVEAQCLQRSMRIPLEQMPTVVMPWLRSTMRKQ